MSAQFVRIVFDLYCQRDNLSHKPEYRVFVNNELFTERTWRAAATEYIQEALPINAEPGDYTVRVDNLTPNFGKFIMRNLHCTSNNATIIDSYNFKVT